MLCWTSISEVLPRIRSCLHDLTGPEKAAGRQMFHSPVILPDPGRWLGAPDRRSERRGRPLTYSGELRHGAG